MNENQSATSDGLRPATNTSPAPGGVDSAPAAERPHHAYSPSSLQSIEACPAYKNRQADTPHERTVAGTRAHASVDSEQDDQRLADKDAVAVAECLDFVNQRREIMEQSGPVTEIKEAYLPIDDLIFSDAKSTTAGYIDHGLINHDKTYAELLDWKFGFWPVEEAMNNLQGIAYCLGMFHAYPTLQKVKFFFKQPHLKVITQAEITRSDVPAHYLRIQTVVARARMARQAGDFATATPHVPVCNFCGNIATCPKVAAMVLKVGKKFHPAGVPDDITPSAMHDPARSVDLLELCQIVSVWAGAFKRAVHDRILRGDAPMLPGYKVQEMSRRTVADMEKLKTVALRHMTKDKFDATLTTTFGALEDIIKDMAPRGSKTEAVESFQKELEETQAVVRGAPYSFLRPVANKKSDD